MFTSEPSLIQRIERMISETPIIDTDTDLNPGRLSAPDIFGILKEPSLLAALASVGMSRSDLDPSLDAGDRIRRIIPHLGRIRNTAPAWCLFRIFRDLHDFHDPHLTESNAGELVDKIREAGLDPARGASIVRDRSKIRTFATRLDPVGDEVPDATLSTLQVLDIDRLFDRGAGGGEDRGDYSALRQLLAGPSTSKPRIQQQVHDWLDRHAVNPGRIFRVSSADGRTATPDLARVNQALAQADAGKPLSVEDIDELARLVNWQVFAWHAERGATLQVTVGGGSNHPGGRVDMRRFGDLSSAFRHFGKARFDLLAGCDFSRRQAVTLAARHPNVFASGSWRSDFSAVAIADFIARGIHEVPMAKLTAFASGASSAEWTYAKFQMARKAMASGFARLIEAGYYEEEEIPPILLQILHETPQLLYSTARSGEP